MSTQLVKNIKGLGLLVAILEAADTDGIKKYLSPGSVVDSIFLYHKQFPIFIRAEISDEKKMTVVSTSDHGLHIKKGEFTTYMEKYYAGFDVSNIFINKDRVCDYLVVFTKTSQTTDNLKYSVGSIYGDLPMLMTTINYRHAVLEAGKPDFNSDTDTLCSDKSKISDINNGIGKLSKWIDDILEEEGNDIPEASPKPIKSIKPPKPQPIKTKFSI